MQHSLRLNNTRKVGYSHRALARYRIWAPFYTLGLKRSGILQGRVLLAAKSCSTVAALPLFHQYTRTRGAYSFSLKPRRNTTASRRQVRPTLYLFRNNVRFCTRSSFLLWYKTKMKTLRNQSIFAFFCSLIIFNTGLPTKRRLSLPSPLFPRSMEKLFKRPAKAPVKF